MIDYYGEIKEALEQTGLPVDYELFLHSGLSVPRISYMELTNYAVSQGDTLGYSVVVYQIKIWSDRISDIQKYAQEIDNLVRPLGFQRTGCSELSHGTMIQKILTYQSGAAIDKIQ